MTEIYLISGLGADKRVFDFIDFSGFKIDYVNWIDPLGKESVESYARRLLGQIGTTKPILVGVSFGGMVAVEIAKSIETQKVILISSARTRFDIPIYFRILGRLGLNKLIPTRLFKSFNPLTFWFFGAKTEIEKNLLRKIINETDDIFLRWAVDRIVNWRNTTVVSNLVHIHGTADKMLPLKTADFKIRGGEHLMIVSKAEELSGLVKNILG